MAVSKSCLPASVPFLTRIFPLWETPYLETPSPRLTQVCLLWDLVELSLLTLVNSIYVLLLLLFVCLFVLLDPESYHIVLAGLELTKIPLPLLPEWWDKLLCRHI